MLLLIPTIVLGLEVCINLHAWGNHAELGLLLHPSVVLALATLAALFQRVHPVSRI